MKKISWLTILAAVALLPGCSNDNELLNEGSEVEAVIGDSEVEIKLSSGTAATRATIQSDENHAFEAEGLGIFCVAKGKQNPEINPPAPDIDWTRYGEYGKTDVLMHNVPANAVIDTIDNVASTSIVWADPEAQYFYPISNWYKYSFFGYYPVQDDAKVTTLTDGVMVSMEIDGYKDVLVGKASVDEEYAYSAKYFRTGKHEAPTMTFFHYLSRFTFTVEAGADYTGSKENATRMSVKEIVLLDMPYKFEFVAAAIDEDLWGTGFYYDDVKDFYLYDENADTLAPVQVSAEERRQVGDALMVLPGLKSSEETDSENYTVPVYGIRIVLVDEKGKEFVSEFPLSLSEYMGENGPEMGHSYNINMTVYGPQEIKLNATLRPWTIVETDIPIEL